MSVLRDYFAWLDTDGCDPLEVLSQDLTFDFVLGAHSVSGGRAELAAHLASAASADTWHHVVASGETDGVEFLVGEARGGSEPLTFLAAAEVGPDGRILRYLVTCSSTVRFHPDQ